MVPITGSCTDVQQSFRNRESCLLIPREKRTSLSSIRLDVGHFKTDGTVIDPRYSRAANKSRPMNAEHLSSVRKAYFQKQKLSLNKSLL